MFASKRQEFQSGKFRVELDSLYANEGYQTKYHPGMIMCEAVEDHGYIIIKGMFLVPIDYFADCEDVPEVRYALAN
ncbi:hypothetical protein [Alicyclobacillus fodiniaquatilis]|uniref:Uncharacterized protein n=1 Tax=Alicyclobacillus fodiniaquatilis TaxID=1661150 RepID=A0ABW4JJC3_9BACL